MYFRMLKKDLTDKKGLNITLFIFMILASVLIVVSAQLLYTSVIMSEKTYQVCNTSDITMITRQSISDKEERERIIAWFENVPEYESMYIEDRMSYPGMTVKYVVNEDEKKELCSASLIFSTVQTERNIPYNMDDKILTVPDGCVALPQNLLNSTDARVGDKIQITTQMGNIYEFTVSDFYKEPSASMCKRLLFSDDDYSVLADESPLKYDIYEIFLKEINDNYADRVLEISSELILNFKNQYLEMHGNKEFYKIGDGIIALVVSIVLSIVGVFMIFMIFVTVHFSMKSAVKREEKEIGIMKAIGVYSFSYRVLFAVKYIVFAVVGGIIGMFAAIPLGDILMDRFVIHVIQPVWTERIVIAIIAVLVLILIMVLFTLYSLSGMNKISVMDTIHGENKGERFKKIPGLFLYKKKIMSIPLFLALNDISGRVKRYAYLILTYVIGICMVFLAIQAKDSICSMEYVRKYLQCGAWDFDMEIGYSYFEKLYEREGSAEGVYRSINDTFAKNGIPASTEFFSNQIVVVSHEGEKLSYDMNFGIPDPAEVEYVKGGKAPELYNEVALSYLSSKQAGIMLGDIISIEYDKYNDDGISNTKVKEEFIVTAFFEGQCFGIPYMIMGKEFTGAVSKGNVIFQNKLDCTEEEYEKYYEKMDALFTDDEIKFTPKEETFNKIMREYIVMFDLVMVVVCTVVAIIVALMTILYENIFIEEETSDVAVLKSMGFDRMPVRMWHVLRMVLLIVISYLVATVLTMTAGNFLLGKLISAVIYVCDFQVITRFFANFVVVPVCAVMLVVICLILMLKSVDKIQIWRIRNE